MTCKRCDKPLEKYGAEFVYPDAAETGHCFLCAFWNEKIPFRDDPSSVRVAGRHYFIQPPADKPEFAGFAGRSTAIRFHDGREVVTCNLWYQGRIPATHRDELPDNAEFTAT